MFVIEDLLEAMKRGEEIEAFIGSKVYFLQPDYDSFDTSINEYTKTVVFDCTNKDDDERIFVGTADEVINYKLVKGYTFKDNLDDFDITW